MSESRHGIEVAGRRAGDGGPGACWRRDRTTRADPPSATSAGNGYVDPALCAACHGEIASHFSKTGMGRSFYRLKTENAVEDFGEPFYHAASDSYIVMFARGGRYYQRRWQKGYDGAEINVDEKTVDFVMGSGNHGRTYLHFSNRGTLQQLPLGWYAEKGGYWGGHGAWLRSSGLSWFQFDRGWHDLWSGMFCHNGGVSVDSCRGP